MTGKERMRRALNHEEADRVPLDIGSFNNSAMHYLVEQTLKKELGLTDNGTEIKALNQMVTVPDDSVLDYFDVDTRSIYFDETAPWQENPDGTFTDMWGIGYRLNPDGYYYNMCAHPLQDAEEIADIENYSFPEPNEHMLVGLEQRVERYADKCLVLEGMREVLFGLPAWLRGSVNFYMDLVSDDGMADALLEKLADYHIRRIDFVMDRIGDKIDVFKLADDLGTQTSLILSPDTYREKIKPHHARLISHLKSKWDVKVLFHVCGAIRPILGDLIEIGVDAINPVQISADGMDPASLKKEFGNNLTFWGGGVDTQHILGTATPAEVKADVKKNMQLLRPGGGFVFTQVHNIMPNVPLENVLAMYEAFRENAAYGR